ncbi:MAG: hypothetical protein JWO69_859 [Thermoleophilia bacterium]|jgi:hypothetical protein|nr:hypothetical protein [Thermoleophilia bacterium]
MPDSPASTDPVELFADALYELLQQRALSWGLVDVGMDVDGGNIDCELMFGTDPDMGFSIDARDGVCRYCVLVGDDAERWLDDALTGLDIIGARTEEQRADVALVVANGVLDARRPLLPKSDWTP